MWRCIHRKSGKWRLQDLHRVTSVCYSVYMLYYQYWLNIFFLLKNQECLHSSKKKHQHQTSWVTFLSYWLKLYFNSDLEIPTDIFSNLTLKLPFWLTVCSIYKWRKNIWKNLVIIPHENLNYRNSYTLKF